MQRSLFKKFNGLLSLVVLLTTQCCLQAHAGQQQDWLKASQFIKIGNFSAADASAALDVVSTSKGVLLPRLTSAQKAAISSPANGLLIYDTDLNRLESYNGTAWGPVGRLLGTATTLDASAALQIDSTTRGVLLPRMTTAQRTAIATPANGLMVYDTDLKSYYQYASTAWTAVGSGSGSGTGTREYVSNTNAEQATTGWNTYADAAGVLPVDGTGGTASALTFTRTTTSTEIIRETASFKLAKAASNAQGQGVSTDFALDPQDYKGSGPVYVSFDYVTSANYVAGDIKVFAFDKDFQTPLVITILDGPGLNGALPAALTGGRFTGVFYPATNVDVNYRIGFHVASTNATAYNFFFDNVHVGGANLIPGAIVTAWQSYTPTWVGLTPTTNDIQWRRVGGSLEVRGRTVSSAVSGSTLTMSLPNAYVIDATFLPGIQQVGVGTESPTASQTLTVLGTGGQNVFNFSKNNTASVNPNLAQTGSAILTPGSAVLFNISVPIQGWSSGAQVSTGEMNAQTPVPMYTTSAVKTPTAATGQTNAMTGNSLTLTRGNWQLTGNCRYSNSGSSAAYGSVTCYWAGSNGLDSATAVTPLSTNVTIIGQQNVEYVFAPTSGTFENNYSSAPIMDVTCATATCTVYLDAYQIMGTAANGRVTVFASAKKIPDFTLFGVVPTSLPTQQIFNAPGAATYVRPNGVRYIKVRAVGGGGGGGGGGSSTSTAGTAGGNTNFGSTLLVANGGGGGGGYGGLASAGGSASISAPAFGVSFGGGAGTGSPSNVGSVTNYLAGGAGAPSPFGGAGGGQSNAAGTSAIGNTGSGGGGGGTNTSTTLGGGAGGSAGGYAEATINNPASSYTLSVGSAGPGGGAGVNGYAGGGGSTGLVVVDEYY